MISIAWSKCGEVIATEADSGDPNYKTILGEYDFVGGAYEEYQGYKMAFAFSGALSEEDLAVAKYGIAIETIKMYCNLTYKTLKWILERWCS